MPKAELHVHLEGTLEPELLFELAEKNRIEIPWTDIGALRAAYDFTDLSSFLSVFYQSLRVLVTEQDFYDVTIAFLKRARDNNVLHVEIFVSASSHLDRGIAFDTFMKGITRALRDHNEAYGGTGGILLSIQRHLSEDVAFSVLEQAAPWREHILGFGLGGAEVGNPPSKFQRVFDRCRELGYRVVAHAGEEGPASYVAEAMDLLKVDRIDHGVRCLDDPDLVRRLVQRRMPLTVCPCSNVRLGVFSSMSGHNLKKLLDAGLMVTINSDDPSLFGAYMNVNFAAVQDALGLTDNDLYQMARNGFEAAFLPEDRKRFYCEQVDRYHSGSLEAAAPN